MVKKYPILKWILDSPTYHVTIQNRTFSQIFEWRPKSGIFKFHWVANGLDFEWYLKYKNQPFEIQTNGCYFVKNHLKSRQKRHDFEWSGFWMVGIIVIAITKGQPFEIRSSNSSDFKCFRILNHRISDHSCIQIHPDFGCLVFGPCLYFMLK